MRRPNTPRVALACASGIAFGLVAAVASPAAASDAAGAPLLFLEYRRPAALVPLCPDESSFRNLVVARLGYDPFVATADAPDRLRVELTLLRGRVQAAAALSREGQLARTPRAIDGPSAECEAVVTALATTVAIAIDPLGEGAARAPDEPPAAKPQAPALPTQRPVEPSGATPSAAAPAPGSPSAEGAFTFFVSGAPIVSLGVAPSVSLGGEAGVGARRGRFSLQILARAETTPGSSREPSGDRLSASVYTGSLLSCGALAHARICGLLRLGEFQGEAPDLAKKLAASSFYAAIGLRAGYDLRVVDALSVEPSLEVEIPLEQTLLKVDGNTVWSAPVASAGAAVTAHAFF